MTDKEDGFRTRQGSSIDGFLTGAGQQPRRPLYRGSPLPVQPQSPPTTGKPQAEPMSDIVAPGTHRSMPPKAWQPQPFVPANEARAQAVSASTPVQVPARREQRIRPAAELKPQAAAKPAKQKQKGRFKRTLKKVLKIFGIILLVAVLAFGARFYKDIAKLTGNRNPFSLFGAFRPAHLDNENGRINILVAGNSADDAGHNGASLTDSIMVMSVNTRNNTAMMLSVPRDLWVNVPGNGHSKINAAYTYGGMDALKGVIEDNLDIPIHYTVLVNYSAFRDLVNAVGGITIKIDSPDRRGIYDSSLDYTTRNCCALAKYPNGSVNLDGKQALNLARARGDGYGSYGFPGTDFTRTEYQRKMLLAIKDKASSTSVIANPFKVSNLVDAVGRNVKTDLQLSQLQTLYTYMKKIPDNKIDSYNINTLKGDNTTMLANYTTKDGQSALIPAAGIDDFAEIAAQIQKLFTATPIEKEAASIVLLNGTNTVGLAHTQATTLSKLGMIVAAQSDAPANQQTTTIVDSSDGKKSNTLVELKRRYSASVVTNKTLAADYPGADFIVIIGQNVAAQQAAAAKVSNK